MLQNSRLLKNGPGLSFVDKYFSLDLALIFTNQLAFLWLMLQNSQLLGHGSGLCFIDKYFSLDLAVTCTNKLAFLERLRRVQYFIIKTWRKRSGP